MEDSFYRMLGTYCKYDANRLQDEGEDVRAELRACSQLYQTLHDGC